MLIQVGALEDSPHSSTLLEGFGMCSHAEHSAREKKKKVNNNIK